MKKAIQSLLGIEMSLGKTEFKPILLIFGIFFFIGLGMLLSLAWIYFRVKLFLLDQYKTLLEEHRIYNKKNKR
jgi:hypothetical protein